MSDESARGKRWSGLVTFLEVTVAMGTLAALYYTDTIKLPTWMHFTLWPGWLIYGLLENHGPHAMATAATFIVANGVGWGIGIEAVRALARRVRSGGEE